MVTLTLDDRLLAAYLFYGSILMLKTWAMSFLTARHRIKNKGLFKALVMQTVTGEINQVLPSPEDYGGKYKDKPIIYHADVERVRRAHRNDLENIPTFLIVVLLYSFSGLPAIRAIWCLRIFTTARILHTIFYLNAIFLPRAVSFLFGAGCTVFLAGNVLYAAIKTGLF